MFILVREDAELSLMGGKAGMWGLTTTKISEVLRSEKSPHPSSFLAFDFATTLSP